MREYFSSAEELDEKREKKKMQVSLELKDMIERMKPHLQNQSEPDRKRQKGPHLYRLLQHGRPGPHQRDHRPGRASGKKIKMVPAAFLAAGIFFIYNICRAACAEEKRRGQSFFSSSGSGSSGDCGLGSRISCKLLKSIISTKNNRASTASMITYTGLNQTTDGMMNAQKQRAEHCADDAQRFEHF